MGLKAIFKGEVIFGLLTFGPGRMEKVRMIEKICVFYHVCLV